MKRLLLSLLMLIVLVSLAGCGKGDIVEGIVDHKAVTGVIDNIAYTILVNRPGDGEPPDQVNQDRRTSGEARSAVGISVG